MNCQQRRNLGYVIVFLLFLIVVSLSLYLGMCAPRTVIVDTQNEAKTSDIAATKGKKEMEETDGTGDDDDDEDAEDAGDGGDAGETEDKDETEGAGDTENRVIPANNKGICLEDQTVLNIEPGINQLPENWPYETKSTTKAPNAYRVFSFSEGRPRAWATWLLRNKYHVLIGFDTVLDNDDVEALVDLYTRFPVDMNTYLLGICVGNEPENTEIGKITEKIGKIRKYIDEGNLPKKPVTCVVNLTTVWLQKSYPPGAAEFSTDYLEIVKDLDVVCFNCYGGYFSEEDPKILLDNSLSWTSAGGKSVIINQFTALRYAMIKGKIEKPLWITETGWSSAPIRSDDGVISTDMWSTVQNQRLFYDNFLRFDLGARIEFSITDDDGVIQEYSVKAPERIFFFCLRDSKFIDRGTNEFFGLFTDQLGRLQEKN